MTPSRDDKLNSVSEAYFATDTHLDESDSPAYWDQLDSILADTETLIISKMNPAPPDVAQPAPPDSADPPRRRRKRRKKRSSILVTLAKYSPAQPRDWHGRWTHTGGGGLVPGAKDIYRTRSVDTAARLISQGKKVQLEQPRQAATLLRKLAAMVKSATEAGTKKPTFDLCLVSVKGTNLFCAQNKGFKRIEMPQLSGKPLPGSRADKTLPHRPSLGRPGDYSVDLVDGFLRHLTKRGVTAKTQNLPASVLKASQREMRGDKVAGMLETLRSGKALGGRVLASSDDYIVDGHHRWAATVGHDVLDNRLGDTHLDVTVIDMPILDVLAEAIGFAEDWGLPQQAV